MGGKKINIFDLRPKVGDIFYFKNIFNAEYEISILEVRTKPDYLAYKMIKASPGAPYELGHLAYVTKDNQGAIVILYRVSSESKPFKTRLSLINV